MEKFDTMHLYAPSGRTQYIEDRELPTHLSAFTINGIRYTYEEAVYISALDDEHPASYYGNKTYDLVTTSVEYSPNDMLDRVGAIGAVGKPYTYGSASTNRAYSGKIGKVRFYISGGTESGELIPEDFIATGTTFYIKTYNTTKADGNGNIFIFAGQNVIGTLSPNTGTVTATTSLSLTKEMIYDEENPISVELIHSPTGFATYGMTLRVMGVIPQPKNAFKYHGSDGTNIYEPFGKAFLVDSSGEQTGLWINMATNMIVADQLNRGHWLSGVMNNGEPVLAKDGDFSPAGYDIESKLWFTGTTTWEQTLQVDQTRPNHMPKIGNIETGKFPCLVTVDIPTVGILKGICYGTIVDRYYCEVHGVVTNDNFDLWWVDANNIVYVNDDESPTKKHLESSGGIFGGRRPLEELTARLNFPAGSGYYVTSILPEPGDWFKIKVQIFNTGGKFFIGSRKLSNADDDSTTIEVTNAHTSYFALAGKINGKRYISDSAISLNTRYVVTLKENGMTSDPVIGAGSFIEAELPFEQSYPLAIGGIYCSDGSVAYTGSAGDIFGIEVYGSDNKLKHRLIPQSDLTFVDEITGSVFQKQGSGNVVYADDN